MSFIFDNDEVVFGIGYISRYRSHAMSSSTISPRGFLSVERYGQGRSSMRKPTRQEALDRLPYVPRVIRGRGKQFPPPFSIPFYALDLAEVLIEIDPLDRIEG